MKELATLTVPQIIICFILAIAFIAAIIAFIRTPNSEKFLINEPVKEPGIEYAPMYSKQERVRIIIKNFAIFIPIFIFMKYWFFSKIAEYSSDASCHSYSPISNINFTGVHLVFYGTFVGIPLLSFVLLIPVLIEAIKILMVGQYPLPGYKVMQLTKYKYGIFAKLHACAGIILVCSFLAIATWGASAASKNIENAKPCAANKALKHVQRDALNWTPSTGAASQYRAGFSRRLALRYASNGKFPSQDVNCSFVPRVFCKVLQAVSANCIRCLGCSASL